jgi:RND superfamily putative drug exporter
VSVVGAITLVPALLAMLGHRIDSLRVIPKRIVAADPGETGFWHRWAGAVVRRPLPVLLAGLALVVLFLIPAFQINPSEAEVKNLPGKGDAFNGREALTAAGISAGVMKPFVVLVEGATPAQLGTFVSRIEEVPGVAGAAAPASWRKGDASLIEAFPNTDSASREARKTISNVKKVLPVVAASVGAGTTAALGGAAPEDRDFVHAVYGNFPYVLAFVILLTILLARVPCRACSWAVVMNFISLGIAFGSSSSSSSRPRQPGDLGCRRTR